MHTKPNINVTPLIDVLLVLLIIFMVISPHRPSRFVAQAPDKPAPEEPNVVNEDLLVTVKADGTYSLNSQPAATLAELNDWLHRALDGRPFDRKTVFLKAPQSDELIEICEFPASGPVIVGPDLTHLAFEVDDLHAFARHAAAKGHPLSDGPTPTGTGSIIAFVDAPEGYEIELIQRGKTG